MQRLEKVMLKKKIPEEDETYSWEDYGKEKKFGKPKKVARKRSKDEIFKDKKDGKLRSQSEYQKAYNFLKRHRCFKADYWCDNSGLPLGKTVYEAVESFKKWNNMK